MEGQLLDFGVSGLLRYSNLIMYDRQTESWWHEFGGEAIVGQMAGLKLEQLPMAFVSWKEFKSNHPDGKVLSRPLRSGRPYGDGPYSGYDLSKTPFAYRGPEGARLPLIERVVAVSIGEESLAVPYSVLAEEPVVHYSLGGQDLVVFYEKGTRSSFGFWEVGSAAVYLSELNGRTLTFQAEGEVFVDEETGSTWTLLGRATSGPLEGEELTPVPHLGNVFWFSWAVHKPGTVVYRGLAFKPPDE